MSEHVSVLPCAEKEKGVQLAEEFELCQVFLLRSIVLLTLMDLLEE